MKRSYLLNNIISQKTLQAEKEECYWIMVLISNIKVEIYVRRFEYKHNQKEDRNSQIECMLLLQYETILYFKINKVKTTSTRPA